MGGAGGAPPSAMRLVSPLGRGIGGAGGAPPSARRLVSPLGRGIGGAGGALPAGRRVSCGIGMGGAGGAPPSAVNFGTAAVGGSADQLPPAVRSIPTIPNAATKTATTL